MRAGTLKQLVTVEQFDGGAWQPYFEAYCGIAQLTGAGDARTFTLETRWREEWETLAGLDHHSEGYRVVWQRSAEVQRLLLIDAIVLPEDRGDAVTVNCDEIVE